MGDTAELKSRKKVIKGQLTRFNTFISDTKNKSKLSEIETRLEKINLLFSEFDDVQFKLELANEGDEEEIETRLEKINLLFSEFDDVQFKLELANEGDEEERVEVEDCGRLVLSSNSSSKRVTSWRLSDFVTKHYTSKQSSR
ncbi:hypothetical protein QE152_g30216 [Popillia japonica]|uniref:Uncharacterized protein n=1 Tax=Popillia japonica TaxID=7064 RepID=A0AAW1JFN5_POPJA